MRYKVLAVFFGSVVGAFVGLATPIPLASAHENAARVEPPADAKPAPIRVQSAGLAGQRLLVELTPE